MGPDNNCAKLPAGAHYMSNSITHDAISDDDFCFTKKYTNLKTTSLDDSPIVNEKTSVTKYHQLGHDEYCPKLPACGPVMTSSISSDSESDDDIGLTKNTLA